MDVTKVERTEKVLKDPLECLDHILNPPKLWDQIYYVEVEDMVGVVENFDMSASQLNKLP